MAANIRWTCTYFKGITRIQHLQDPYCCHPSTFKIFNFLGSMTGEGKC